MDTVKSQNIKRKRRKWKSDYFWGYIFIAVAVIIFIVFTLYPVGSALVISFQKYKPLGSTWVGIANYAALLKDSLFAQSILNTLVYTVFSVPVSIVLSFVLAILIFPLRRKLQTLFKAVYFLPLLASGVAMSIVWTWIYDPTSSGLFNQMVGWLGISNQNWLGSSKTAMFSLLFMSWITGQGKNIIIYLACLLGIPDDFFEVADIDGANFFKKIRYIILPLVKPTTLFLFVTGVIASFQVFQNAYLMTGGGPNNATTMIGLLIFNNAFKYFNFGTAAAQSLVLTVIVAGISVLQFKFLSSDIEY